MFIQPQLSPQLYVAQKPNQVSIQRDRQKNVPILEPSLLSLKQTIPVLILLLIINNYQSGVRSHSIYKLSIIQAVVSPLLPMLLYAGLL